MKEIRSLANEVVAPIRARAARKDKMREELAAHLADIFAHEKQSGHSDAQALEETLRRFGDPREVRRQLQDSVPFIERISFTPIPGLTPGESLLNSFLNQKSTESVLAHSARLTGVLVLFFAITDIAFLLLRLAIRRGTFLEGIADRLRMVAAIEMPGVICLFLLLLLGHAIHRTTWHRPLRPRQRMAGVFYVVLIAVAIVACRLLGIVVFYSRFPPDWPQSFSAWPSLLWCVLLPFAVVTLVFQILKDSRRNRELRDLDNAQ